MINLAPPEIKKELVYAKRNTRLSHWLIALLLALVGIFLVVLAGQIYIDQSIKTYTSRVQQSEQHLKVQKLEEIQKRVQDISSSSKLIVQVLSRQVLFSALLKQIGSAIPQNAVLTGLSITKLQGGIELSAAASDYQTASQVQINLKDPANKIFEKADIISIQCKSPASTPAAGSSVSANVLDNKYPCKVVIKALFGSNNPFLLIQGAPSTTKATP